MGLPTSKPVVSVAQFLLLFTWIFEGRFREKFSKLAKDKAALGIIGIYVVGLIWLPMTNQLDWAFNDLRIKLPLLFLPLVASWIWPLSQWELRRLLNLFVATTGVVSLIGVGIYFVNMPVEDPRILSPFGSHIRFGILLCLCVFIIIDMIRKRVIRNPWGWMLLTYFIAFTILLQSMTALVILATGLIAWLLIEVYSSQSLRLKISFSVIAGFTAIFFLSILGAELRLFYGYDMPKYTDLEPKTVNGAYYIHLSENRQRENGNLVWSYVAMDELRRGWNNRVDVPFDGLDKKDQPLHATLIRYMTSLGIRKDSLGILELSDEDIGSVLNGTTNYRYNDGKSFSDRIYEIIWELENYRYGGDPQGNSVVQRWVYWQTAVAIFKENPMLGVSPGDLRSAFEQKHEELNPDFREQYRKRAHNQYLTFLVSFGVIGFLWILLMLAFSSSRSFRGFLPFTFFLTWTLSFVNEDTLETQIGVSFFVFFILLYAHNQIEKTQSS